MMISKKLKTAAKIWKSRGLRGIFNHTEYLLHRSREKIKYQKWIKREKITDEKRADIRAEIEQFSRKPIISIILPVYNVEEKWLCLCIESVRKQIYQNWELCIADDCSPSPHIRRILQEYTEKDKRIKVVFRKENGHISAASNSALNIATGDFCVLLDHDDELAEHALFHVVKEINKFPETEMIYSDEDLIGENGRRFEPKFKPDFSRDYFYSGNLITHLSAYKTEVLLKIGGFTIGLEGSQDYDLALRVIEEIPEKHIRHIPKILYHWRVIAGSVALSGDEKPYAHDAARRAIRAHLERCGKKASVEQTVYNLHRVRYQLPENLPKVSLILIADEDVEFTKQAINTFIQETDYANFEIVLVSQTKAKPIENAPFSIKTIVCENTSEAEKYNLAVAETDGEILCFVDVNLKPLTKDWLTEIASFAYQNEIGAVGAKLLHTLETILHGGLLIGINGTVGIAHQNFPKDTAGNIGRNLIIGNFSAVSVSCLATKRETFEKVGGFDVESFPNKFFDVDFCLKLLEKNLRNVFMPYAELMLIDEQKSLNIQKKESQLETENFRRRWKKFIEKDSFYNPNLSKENGSFLIEV